MSLLALGSGAIILLFGMIISYYAGMAAGAIGMTCIIMFSFFYFSVSKSEKEKKLESLRIGKSDIVVCALVLSYFLWFLIRCINNVTQYSSASEASKYVIVLGVYVFAREFMRYRGETGKIELMLLVMIALSLLGILCVDAASTQHGTKLLLANYFNAVGLDIDLNSIGYEKGIRMTGILENGNITGSLFGIGIFLGYYINQYDLTKIISSKANKKYGNKISKLAIIQKINMIAFGICLLCFMLSFSMGATGFFVVVYLVCLMRCDLNTRSKLLTQTIVAVVVTFLIGAIASMCLGRTTLFAGIVSSFCLFGNGIVIDFVLKKVKNIQLPLKWILLSIAIYIVIALCIKGPFRIDDNNTLYRGLYLTPGSYTMSYEGEGDLYLKVLSQDLDQVASHTSSEIYHGDIGKGTFTVPENTRIVKLYVYGKGRISKLSYQGTKSGKVALRYFLLPNFLVNRMQGIWMNENFVQRFVFFRDGLVLWTKHPIIGGGPGYFEHASGQVKHFYYRTKYVHNMPIQCLLDGGIIGFIFWLMMFIVTFYKLIKLKKKDAQMATISAALMVFVLLHGLWDVTLVTGCYLMVVVILMGIIHERGKEEVFEYKHFRLFNRCAYLTVLAIFSICLFLNAKASKEYEAMVGGRTSYSSENMKRLSKTDIFVPDLYDTYSNVLENPAQISMPVKNETFDLNFYILQHQVVNADNVDEFLLNVTRTLSYDKTNEEARNQIKALLDQKVVFLQEENVKEKIKDYLAAL